jgi:hypothetical protein
MLGFSPLGFAVLGAAGTVFENVPPGDTPEPPYGAGLLVTYTQLQEAIRGWLHRNDLAQQIPLFIALAEAKLNRIAQVRAMEKVVVLVLEAGAQSVALPAGFISPIAAWLERETPAEKLSARTPESLPIDSVAGTPAFWSIDGGRLLVDCPVAERQRIILRYRGGFALSAANPTNSLLLKHPDLYLYGALLQSAPHIRDVDSMPLWQTMYQQAVQEVNRSESRARAAAPLRTELAAMLGC